MIKEILRLIYFINSRVIVCIDYKLGTISTSVQIIKKIMIMIFHNSEFNTFITPTL